MVGWWWVQVWAMARCRMDRHMVRGTSRSADLLLLQHEVAWASWFWHLEPAASWFFTALACPTPDERGRTPGADWAKDKTSDRVTMSFGTALLRMPETPDIRTVGPSQPKSRPSHSMNAQGATFLPSIFVTPPTDPSCQAVCSCSLVPRDNPGGKTSDATPGCSSRATCLPWKLLLDHGH